MADARLAGRDDATYMSTRMRISSRTCLYCCGLRSVNRCAFFSNERRDTCEVSSQFPSCSLFLFLDSSQLKDKVAHIVGHTQYTAAWCAKWDLNQPNRTPNRFRSRATTAAVQRLVPRAYEFVVTIDGPVWCMCWDNPRSRLFFVIDHSQDQEYYGASRSAQAIILRKPNNGSSSDFNQPVAEIVVRFLSFRDVFQDANFGSVTSVRH